MLAVKIIMFKHFAASKIFTRIDYFLMANTNQILHIRRVYLHNG